MWLVGLHVGPAAVSAAGRTKISFDEREVCAVGPKCNHYPCYQSNSVHGLIHWASTGVAKEEAGRCSLCESSCPPDCSAPPLRRLGT